MIKYFLTRLCCHLVEAVHYDEDVVVVEGGEGVVDEVDGSGQVARQVSVTRHHTQVQQQAVQQQQQGRAAAQRTRRVVEGHRGRAPTGI